MLDEKSSTPAAGARLFAETSTGNTSADPLPSGKLDLDGILTTKTGAIYFGQIKEDDAGIVVVTTPTGDGKVRTVRPIARAQVVATKALGKTDLLKLARIGPHVLARSDVERVVPATRQQPDPKPEDETPAADAAASA